MRNLGVTMIALAVLAVAGCAGDMSSGAVAPTVDVTGHWVGTWSAATASLGSGSIDMTIKQAGPKFSGDLLVTGAPTDPSGYTQGVVSGNEVRILQPTSMTGRLTVQGDTTSGNVQGVVDANATLKRQK